MKRYSSLNFNPIAEAETHSKRALGMVRKAYGDAHPIVASTRIALANTYSQLTKRFADAEQLYLSALAVRENVLGNDHLEVEVIPG